MKLSIGRTGGTCDSVLDLVQVRREPWKPGADAHLPWRVFLQEVTTTKQQPPQKSAACTDALSASPVTAKSVETSPAGLTEPGCCHKAVKTTGMGHVTPYADAREASCCWRVFTSRTKTRGLPGRGGVFPWSPRPTTASALRLHEAWLTSGFFPVNTDGLLRRDGVAPLDRWGSPGQGHGVSRCVCRCVRGLRRQSP